MIELILTASVVTQSVLIVLLLLSIFSWAGIFFKIRVFSKTKKGTAGFLHEFKKGEDFPSLKKAALKFRESPQAVLYLESLRRLQKRGVLSSQLEAESISDEDRKSILSHLNRLLKTVRDEEMARLESFISYFAITGNISPFVGLFGTVLGIIDAFQNISQIGSANIAAVAPGVAEALVATAAGLLTAIPAVIAYNYFLNFLRKVSYQMEGFSEELLVYFEEKLKPSRIPLQVSE